MKSIYKLLNYGIAIVWIINGLFCKVLNFVPRHEEIVARILGDAYSRPLIILIGCSEIVMAVWILTRINSRFCAIAQITIIAAMNILEFLLAPDLLLWGRFNSLFAFVFILLIYCNEFRLNPKKLNHHV
ncbi:hypothetical protein ACM46_11800 [Chryseobacterium angstadtii]|uniref:DoxX family protein n=1 Tax=Chryseobacterium angstadtii TaxID=558151 RepID=A0A0J7IFI6_9FLAO|nr:DoxX-like family protein [Chryseobacterium angstadtii]KMQ64887.1 hypothetical protein ACM46_11800 [Chryseobacterium angstadtii]